MLVAEQGFSLIQGMGLANEIGKISAGESKLARSIGLTL
jgi:hypothetical protein